MIKLEVDWAGDELPELGIVSNDGDDVLVVVEHVGVGAAGWPALNVFAHALPGVPSYRASQELDAWLETVYGVESEEEREDLLTLAQ